MRIKTTDHTRVRNSDSEKLVYDIADDLDGMVAGLVTDRIPYEESAAGLRGRTPHFRLVFLQVRQRTVTHELVQNVSCKSYKEKRAWFHEFIPLKSNSPRVVRASVISSGLFCAPAASEGL